MTAAVEQTHADRFRLFAEMIEQNTLYHPATELIKFCFVKEFLKSTAILFVPLFLKLI